MTKEKANRNEVVGMFLTYCRKTLVNARTDGFEGAQKETQPRGAVLRPQKK